MLLHLKAFALVIACTSHAGSCRFHHIGGSHLAPIGDQHCNSCFLVPRAAATSCHPIVKNGSLSLATQPLDLQVMSAALLFGARYVISPLPDETFQGRVATDIESMGHGECRE